ncbi:type VI secretion system accessory protein TagJ [Singulisphaera rosea]
MKARGFLDKGELVGAIGSLTEEIRKSPSDLTRRIFLFELLCYAGDLTRAHRQLDAIAQLSEGAEAQIGAQSYKDLLAAETARAQLFEEGRRPRFILAPPERSDRHLEALEMVRQGRLDEARTILDRSAAEADVIRGTSANAQFEGFQDADDILAPVLEVFARGSYFWLPWEHIQYLEVSQPKTLRDLLWIPAQVATFDGQLGEVHLPNLYPGTTKSEDDLLKLGRKTEWLDLGSGITKGLGQKLFLIGDDAKTLLELGEVQFNTTSGAADAPASPEQPEDQA